MTISMSKIKKELEICLNYQNDIEILIFQIQFLSNMQPHNAQKRMYQRMNKTYGIQSKLTIVQGQEKSRASILKKIVTISSIKQDIKEIFLKYLEIGGKALDQKSFAVILAHSKSILDNDKQKVLGQDLNNLIENQDQKYSLLFKVLKELVISPIEKSYITKIQKELKEDDSLQEEIQKVQFQLEEQKLKKLKAYEMQKSGYSHMSAKNLRNTFKDVQNFQNKLMRANQKLNQMSSNNDKLREKINQLRKEKNAMEDIYVKLKKELEMKKQNVQKTIKFAGDAYYARNKAQQDLKHLKQQAEIRKQQFKQQCQKLNNEIQHDLRFKQFIKSKEIQRDHLQKLEKEIQENQCNIELKKQQNLRIDQQYKKSLEKQMQIKKSFDKIKKQIGYNDNSGQNKDLLNVFVNLYEKNIIMKQFVTEITKQVQDLEQKIESKKEEIQKMYLKGTADEVDKQRLNEQYRVKFQFYQRKKEILDAQFEKSVSTLQTIKKYLEDIFEQIGIDPEIIDKLKNCNLNQDNLTQFLGQLQKKGLDAISQYGKLVSQQLKSQKGANWEIQKQIDELNNIITLQNVNSMNNCNTIKLNDYPSELIIKLKDEKAKEQQLEKPLTLQDFKKYAIESLEQYQKKQIPKEKHLNKKYNIAPVLVKKRK